MSKLSEIERLQALKDRGELTEAEFAALKAEILENRGFSLRDSSGIVAVVFAIIGFLYPEPWFDVAISLVAVVMGFIGIRSHRVTFRGLAIAGIFLGFFGIIAGIFVSLGLVT